MSDSLDLLRRMGRAAPPASEGGAPDQLEPDEAECGAFGYLRGVRERAVMLELRLSNGDSLAFPYHWLGPVRYNPSAGLLLRFVGDLIYLVLLEGSNLNRRLSQGISLYERGLLRHRVTWIREMTRPQVAKTAEGEVTIERIRTHSHRPDEEPTAVEWLGPFQVQV